MYYYQNFSHGNHWEMISKMLMENYETPEHHNSAIMLGLHNKFSIKEIIAGTPELKTKDKIIVYQTEPLVESHWFSAEKIIENIREADEVWDYDLQNVEILKRNGIDVKYCPLKYTENIKTINNSAEPEIDLLFYGSYTKNRTKMIDDLLNHYSLSLENETWTTYANINFVWLFGIYHPELDNHIANSKIILNMNPYDGETRQQQTRIFHALINGKCVISEKSPINYFGDNIVEFSGFQDLGNKVVDILHNNSWRNYPFKSNDYQSFISKQNI
jgi:hypothetical protein